MKIIDRKKKDGNEKSNATLLKKAYNDKAVMNYIWLIHKYARIP